MLCCATAIFAQNDKISYQAVVRDTANRLVVNKTVTVTVNVFNGDATTATYSETHTNVQTNYNGMFSLQIGNGTNKNGDWNAINWKNARVTTAVLLNGTELATLEMPLTAVPYTFYADSATLAGFATNAHYSDSVNLNVIAHYLETYQIPTEAEVNVQSDWAVTDTTSDTYIQHKPNISDSIGTYLTNNHYIDQTALYNQGYLTSDSTVITNLQTNVTDLQSDVTHLQGGIEKEALCDSVTDCVTNLIDTKLANYTTTANLPTTIANQLHDTANNVRSEVNTKLATKANAADVYPKSETYTKTEVNGMVNDINSGVNTLRDSVKANITAIGAKADTGSVYTKTATYSKTEVNELLNTKANTTDIPTTVSTFTNDAKYVSNNSCDSLDFCGLIAIVNNLATDMRGFQHDVNNLKDSINDLNAKISALENTIRILAGYQQVFDLSTVTSDTTIYNGQTVTGTLNGRHKISILHGAIVTLNGVNIGDGDSGTENSAAGAGLTCLGDATIILKDGTTNTVRGLNDNYPGVFVPVGSTLTIQGEAQGTGKLIASSNGYGAGIGGGYSISCGNIIIKSGTIEATGGDFAAGIGSGLDYPSSCGNITIENTVNHVKATKGTNATNSIGAGIYGSCSTVTIEAGANVIQN